MKILLTAINAKYIHSNLAVHSLRAYAREYRGHVDVAEYTINHQTDYILQELYRQRPDVLCFSCYIWNISCVCQLAEELHRLRPELPIWVGGPEVSFDCTDFLEGHPAITGIMRGEGEAVFRELCGYYVNPQREESQLSQIRGLVYRDSGGGIQANPEREPLSMDELPFCYEDLEEFENRILYYESSRGCPFGCSYCLSSLEKSLRFRSLKLVERELSFFLEHRVRQVKFVDRTFNCNHGHAMAIWRFLKEHDNGVTNFHFEISADLLTEEEIALLSSLRPGLVQLEIGVQSANLRTVAEIRRTMDLERLEETVERIKSGNNIHQHLDLIAGLPWEDFDSFRKSFDRIYALHPQQLQLGFLKVLKGSYMYENRNAYGLVYHAHPPYEVMRTRWLSYEEILKIKHVEEMLEVYYNSGQFVMTMQILEQAFQSPFEMFLRLGEFYEAEGLFGQSHSRIRRCEILLEFVRKRQRVPVDLCQESLTFDLYYRENMKSRPVWAPQPSTFRIQQKALVGKGRNMHAEPFYYEFQKMLRGEQEGYPKKREQPQFYIFSYEERDALTGQAKVMAVEGEM